MHEDTETVIYNKTVKFSGDRRKAIESARSFFMQAGYRIEHATEDAIVARRDAGFSSFRYSGGIDGASPVVLRFNGDQLTVNAEYGGIERTRRFILKLLLLLSLFFLVVLVIPFAVFFPGKFKLLALLPVLIMALQAPFQIWVTIKIMKRRTDSALDNLTHNIMTVS